MFETMTPAGLRYIAVVMDAYNTHGLSLPDNIGMDLDDFVCHCAEKLADLTDFPTDNMTIYVWNSEIDFLTPKQPDRISITITDGTTGEINDELDIKITRAGLRYLKRTIDSIIKNGDEYKLTIAE